MSMERIEQLTKTFSEQRSVLVERATTLEREKESLVNRKINGIKSALKCAIEAESKLIAALEKNKDLFEKPKTHVFHGIKVGFIKGKGSADYDDAAMVISLIKKKLPEKADILIKKTEKLLDNQLKKLEVAEAAKIAVTVTGVKDEPISKAVDTEAEKVIKALMKDHMKEQKK